MADLRWLDPFHQIPNDLAPMLEHHVFSMLKVGG